MVRLVTFLGLGRLQDAAGLYYEPCRYGLDGQVSPETTLHDVATLLAYGCPAHVVALGTEEVRGRWFGEDKLYESRLRELVKGDLSLGFELLPKGTTPDERWQMFSSVVRLLDPHALQGALHERQAPSTIVLDITHGFRSQPFFAASAVAFARSQRRRLQQDTVPAIRILYAAFDAKGGDGVAPVWDLTQITDVLAWDAAIDGLMRYGRADDLERLTLEDQKHANARVRTLGGTSFPRLKGFADASRRFADGLATARIPALMTELAGALVREIDRCRPDIVQRIPPLAEQLDELVAWAGAVGAPTAISQEGVAGGLALMSLYLRLQRYAEAAITLREMMVTAQTLRRPAAAIKQPAHGKSFDEQRVEDDRALGAASNASTRDPLAEAYRAMADLRNDVEHGGFRSSARAAHRVRAQLDDQLAAVAPVLSREPETAVPTVSVPPLQDPPTLFLNISYHGIASWSPDQLEAARALELGEPADLPDGLPLVDPRESEAGVLKMTAALAERAVALGARGALVTGEYTLSFALVDALTARGVRCFAATTERQIREIPGEGGSVRKESVFRFVRLREYARLIERAPDAHAKS